MLHIKFQVPRSSGSLVLQPTTGVTDRWTDGQTDRPKPICPLNFFETLQSTVEEKIKKKKKKKRRERKMDLQVANPTEYNERKNKNGTQ